MPVWISYSLFIETALKSTVVLGAAWVVAMWLRQRSQRYRRRVPARRHRPPYKRALARQPH